MLDIGGWEFLLIAVLGIIVIGPKDLPVAIRTVTTFVRRAREMAREFQSGLEDIARETELDKIADEVTADLSPDSLGDDLRYGIENTIDPHGDIRGSLADDDGEGAPSADGGDGPDDDALRAGYDGGDYEPPDEADGEAPAEGGGDGEAAGGDGDDPPAAAADGGDDEPGGRAAP